MTRRQFLLAGAGAGLGTASCRGQSVASLAATDSGAELAYWQDQAALIDPAAYVWTHGAGFSLNVPAGKRWYARNLSAIKADGYRVARGCSTIATSGPKAFILNDPAITTADLGKRVSGPNITASAPATSETYVVDVRNPGQAIISHPATAAASGFSVEVWSDRYLRDPSINAAQMMPSGEAIHGASALSVETASAYICKPELVIPARYGSGSDNRYLTDPRALYYTRLQMLQALAPHNVAAVVPAARRPGA